MTPEARQITWTRSPGRKPACSSQRPMRRIFGLTWRFHASPSASIFKLRLVACARGLMVVLISIGFRRAKHQRENRSDTWRGGQWDDCQAGQTSRTDAARRRAVGSSGSLKPKASLPAQACEPERHPAKPTCRQPRPLGIGSATWFAEDSKPSLWTIADWPDAEQSHSFLKPTMAEHSPVLTLPCFGLLFS